MDVGLAIINEQDLAVFRKLNPKEMTAIDNDYRKILPTSEIMVTNTMLAYHHEGLKHVQMPYGHTSAATRSNVPGATPSRSAPWPGTQAPA